MTSLSSSSSLEASLKSSVTGCLVMGCRGSLASPASTDGAFGALSDSPSIEEEGCGCGVDFSASTVLSTISFPLLVGLLGEVISTKGFTATGTTATGVAAGQAAGKLPEGEDAGGDSATCVGRETEATPSGLPGLSGTKGLRAERGLREGIRAGKAMLRICKPGILPGEVALL